MEKNPTSLVEQARLLLDAYNDGNEYLSEELTNLQLLLEKCDKNALDIASNIAHARRTKNNDILTGNALLLKEQNEMLNEIIRIMGEIAKQ